jgi:CheY-like chemotaxis protein
MPDRLEAVAFDVDTASLITLRQVFPEWQIETVTGATARSLQRDWNPAGVDLLLVGVRDGVAETLSLCRALRGQAGRAQTPLFVLVAPGQDGQAGLASAALRVGAHGCLALPVHTNALLLALARALAATSQANPWRDDGGEA